MLDTQPHGSIKGRPSSGAIQQPSVKTVETDSMVCLMPTSEYGAYPSPYCRAFSPTLALRKGCVSGPSYRSEGAMDLSLFTPVSPCFFSSQNKQGKPYITVIQPSVVPCLPHSCSGSRMRVFQCSGFCIFFTPLLTHSF